MRKLAILIAAAFVVACFAGPALADKPPPGPHYNLNVIGFANCDWEGMNNPTDGCYKGQAVGNSNGHRLFIPLRTKHGNRNLCNSELGAIDSEIAPAELAKGVRILVSDGADLGPVDFDGTDGLATFTLPCGQYQVWARAVGKPGDDFCLEWNTLICTDEFGTRVPCDTTIGGEKYVLVGAFDVDRKKGQKPHWDNVSDQIIPDAIGAKYVNYDPFLWLVYNNHIRILQLRFYQVGACLGPAP